MKIKKINTKINKLINLKIFKTESNIKTSKIYNLNIKNTESQFKKSLQVIYKFHICNKRILFIGSSIKTNKNIRKLLKNTKHIFVPETMWINGAITNTPSIFKYLSKKHVFSNEKTSKSLFNLKHLSNLIVVLNEYKNNPVLAECCSKRIPTISLNSKFNSITSNFLTYKISNNFDKKFKSNFFFSILNAIFKKAEKLRKKKIKYNFQQKQIKKNIIKKLKKKNEFFKKKKTKPFT